MFRFLIAAFALFMLAGPVSAEGFSNPPLTGDMIKMKPFAEPKYIPEVILSKAETGLAYLSQYKGKVVLLNIWATWCPPCISELPSLNALQHAMGGDDFQVVTVSIDQMDVNKVRDFMVDNKWDALLPYMDANMDIQKLEILDDAPGVPITIILDRKMRAVALMQGDADWNGRSARAVVQYYIENLPTQFEMNLKQ